jgi:MoaA/NifB/PqqE/SkfB family radical SAM enzyme
MLKESLLHTYKRYRTIKTGTIKVLPVVILMPHSACNCRCIMCDIWKGNKNLKELAESDVSNLLISMKKFETKMVLMSGGEALLNPNFFRFCDILRKQSIRICLLSTGLTLKKHAAQLTRLVDEIIVSLDGDEETHDTIRNIPGAFQKLYEGIKEIRSIDPLYKILGRTVIHKLNFRKWSNIIETAQSIGLNSISFLPADVSSHAFNREMLWNRERQQSILPSAEDLPELKTEIEKIIGNFHHEFQNHFILEPPQKIRQIYKYYAAFYGLSIFPEKKCNAPFVSAVVEADGSVRPCFFHHSFGNVRKQSLEEILNSKEAISFRKKLDVNENPTCIKCVCHLHLKPFQPI